MFHGAGGPQHMSDIHHRHPTREASIEGAAELGLPTWHDYNGASQEGVTCYQQTIKNGTRASAAVSFLRPAMRRDNPHVVTRAMMAGLELDGAKVTGVHYRRGGQDHQCAGRARGYPGRGGHRLTPTASDGRDR